MRAYGCDVKSFWPHSDSGTIEQEAGLKPTMMIYLRCAFVGILALLVSLVGGLYVFGLTLRLFGKQNTFYVLFSLHSPLLWGLAVAIFGAACLIEFRRTSSKARRQ